MTKPYSLDLRERVTKRVAAGDSVRAVATIFTVSVASVVRWSQRLRRTGSAAGGKMGGHRACTLIGERGWLMERIAAEPEVTGRVGKNIRRGLILPVSSSSMKPGSRPTWLPSEVGARGAGGSRQRSRTVTGRQ